MKSIILLESIKERHVIAVISAIGIFFVNPLIQRLSTPLAFQIWSIDIFQKPESSIPYIIFSILFGIFVSLYLYSKNKCIDCKPDARTGFGGSAFGFVLGVCPACFSFIGFLIPLGGSIFLTRYYPIFMIASITIILFSIYKLGGFRKTSLTGTMNKKNVTDISKSVGTGLQKIFGLNRTPKNLEELQLLILKSHDSNKSERTVLAWIGRHYVEFGVFPTSEKITKELNIDSATVQELLQKFERKGFITFGKNGEINGAYGVTSSDTPHSIAFGNKSVHVWCAIDSLGIPLTLNKHASISSKCAYCKSPVNVRIEYQKLAEYNSDMVVFMGFAGNIQKKVSENFCPYINFFCSNQHLDQWKKNKSSVQGISLDLPTAVELSKHLFVPWGESNEYNVKFCWHHKDCVFKRSLFVQSSCNCRPC
ncbi:MAG: organomercurial lyase [Nitrosotalea sp.]